MKPELALALTNLRDNRDFKLFLEALKEDLEHERTRCEEGDGPVLFRAQGSAKKIKELITAYDQAPSMLEKLNKQG